LKKIHVLIGLIHEDLGFDYKRKLQDLIWWHAFEIFLLGYLNLMPGLIFDQTY
jgi:hypothetical protein